MPSTRSVVFCGTPEFAIPSLEALLNDPAFSVDLVLTQPDKPVGRRQIQTPPPVKTFALEHNIPVFQPKNINAEFFGASETNGLKPDFIITVAYGQILKKPILDLPTAAAINLHPSLLPLWRGASPIQNAILAGDKETGVTIQIMAEEMDAGPVLAQERTTIDEQETAQTLHDRLAGIGAALLLKTLKKPLKPKPQDESQATFCEKLTRKDGDANLSTMTAEEIDRKVRALVPWPGVRCAIEGNEVKLLETSLEETDSSITLECAKGTTLHILKLQPPGKKEMTGGEWKRGRRKK